MENDKHILPLYYSVGRKMIFLVARIATVMAMYAIVPLQGFTASSDIDWSKPIPDIDRQFYAKYGLTEDEQKFIESMIKPME